MLPAGSRLRRRSDFTTTLRRSRGARAGGLLVVHVDLPAVAGASAQVGFVVSRAVGPAVTRNLVRRRLRHLAAERLNLLPAGVRVVVRALPASAGATWAELGGALDRALASAVLPAPSPRPRTAVPR